MQRSSTRQLESLDWYRDATRRGSRSSGAVQQILRWLRSARFLAFHIGVFALGVTIALAINVARAPGDLWVDRLALSWVLLLVVHAAIIVLVFTIGLLGTSAERLPIYVPQNNASNPPATEPKTTEYAWPEAPPRPSPATPQPATTTVSRSTAADTQSAGSSSGPTTTSSVRRPVEAASNWPGAAPDSGSDMASWREVSPAAWLRRKRRSDDETVTDSDSEKDNDAAAPRDQ
ncbi:MAG: hypothetical protein WKF81_11150 [Thermomicrobiales bacterium]